MTEVWGWLLGVVVGAVLVYVVLLLLLWRWARRHPETATAHEAVRLVPDLARLLRRLVADDELPLGIRLRLVLLLAYLASPVDLVPDFVPVLGYVDDAVIVALVLRSTVRRAGPASLARHWPGTPTGLRVVERLAGVRAGSDAAS